MDLETKLFVYKKEFEVINRMIQLNPGLLGMQVAGILFGLFMIFLTNLYYKRHEISSGACIAFMAVWISFIGLALFPAVLDPLLEGLHFARRLDFFIVCGFMFLIILVFHNYHIVTKTSKKMEEMVRKLAYKELEESKQDGDAKTP